MVDIARLAREHSDLDASQVERLAALVREWDLIADLAFADLVLWLPTWNGGGFVAVAHQRPDTGRTLFPDDVVGTFVARGRRRVLDRALASGRQESDSRASSGVEHRVFPILEGSRVLALLSRYATPSQQDGGRLDAAYTAAAEDLCVMAGKGIFPFEELGTAPSMRVGGGLMRLTLSGEVDFASPNAVSAFRRLGWRADVEGASLAAIARRLQAGSTGTDGDLLRVASGRRAGVAELEHAGTTVAIRAIPLVAGGARSGALVLVRDVSDVRRRERALVTKDATLREVHHRIKNNLQMVAALLRMQSRRVSSSEAKLALAEAGHRIGAIALVHEALSAAPEGEVDFDAVCDRLLEMVGELMPDATVRRTGTVGRVPSDLATPLAMAIAELLANAAEHGAREGRAQVVLRAARTGVGLEIAVEDAGPGLPAGFDPEASGRLGLGIVGALMTESGGSADWLDRLEGGVKARISLPAKAFTRTETGTP